MREATIGATAAVASDEGRPGSWDFDLHGTVGLRLLNATVGDARAVAQQLGLTPNPLAREPDILIRFTERLELPHLRYLGLGDAAFTEDAFLLLRGRHKSGVRVQIPLADVGGRCEIVCESGLSAVPLLIAIVNLTALSKGVLPLHAAAFQYRGTGVVVTGWAKGGKTETLLGFMARGATYIGDEWIYVSADGSRLHGIPEPLTIWDWHLAELPQYRALLTRAERGRQRAVRLAQAGEPRLRGQPGRLLRRALPAVEGMAAVQVEPERLFGPGRCSGEGPFDVLVLTSSNDHADTTVSQIEPSEVARRMVFSLQFERLDLLAAYWKHRFAFPGVANRHIEEGEARQRELLERAFAGKRAWAVSHPYPVQVNAVVEAMEPLLA